MKGSLGKNTFSAAVSLKDINPPPGSQGQTTWNEHKKCTKT